MSSIQTILYENTVTDLCKASALYSTAEYEEALPHLLRRLPLLEHSYLENETIRKGFSLLSRTYLKCMKYDEAIKTLEDHELSVAFQALYLHLLLKKKEYKKASMLFISSNHTPEKYYSIFMKSIALLFDEQYEEALLLIRQLLAEEKTVSFPHWTLYRAFLFELEDQSVRFSAEADEAAILINKEITQLFESHWYSNRELPSEWKEYFIDYTTSYFAPEQWEFDEKSVSKTFPQPVALEYEWALDKLLAHIDSIPPTEVARTLSSQD